MNSARGSELIPFFGDLGQSERLSKINPHLWNSTDSIQPIRNCENFSRNDKINKIPLNFYSLDYASRQKENESSKEVSNTKDCSLASLDTIQDFLIA